MYPDTRYFIALDTVTRILYTLLFHVLTLLLHIFTGIHVIDYFCSPVAQITAPIIWIIATWIFLYSRYMIISRSDIDIPVTEYVSC